ncbi:MAG TPA: serine protease [Dehalococcoidia bacterium]|nr:serine protease [Dehalococcoidia bacterium]
MGNRLQTENKLKELYFKYSWCILKIIVEDKFGDIHVGTGFHIGKGLVATARHILDNKKIKSIGSEASVDPVVVNQIHLSANAQIDVAVLETSFSLEKSMDRVFYHIGKKNIPARECRASYLPLQETYDDWIGSELILSRCLIIGYPQIPTMYQTTLFAVAADVNAVTGSYAREHAHYIVSNIPRGGFSGAPVISEYDFVLGIVTTSFTKRNGVTELGFCGAVSVEPLFVVLSENNLRPEGISDEFWEA